MPKRETAPALSPKQADNAFLAACNALLLAMATNSLIDDDEADVLCDAMPDSDLSAGLRAALIRFQHMAAPR